MSQEEQVQTRFRLAKPGDHKVVTSRPGYPIVLVVGPADFQPYVVQMTMWQGQVRVSIRQHYPPKDGAKVLLPSKRGIDLTPELANWIAVAIQKVIQDFNDPEFVAIREMGAQAQTYEPGTIEEIPF